MPYLHCWDCWHNYGNEERRKKLKSFKSSPQFGFGRFLRPCLNQPTLDLTPSSGRDLTMAGFLYHHLRPEVGLRLDNLLATLQTNSPFILKGVPPICLWQGSLTVMKARGQSSFGAFLPKACLQIIPLLRFPSHEYVYLLHVQAQARQTSLFLRDRQTGFSEMDGWEEEMTTTINDSSFMQRVFVHSQWTETLSELGNSNICCGVQCSSLCDRAWMPRGTKKPEALLNGLLTHSGKRGNPSPYVSTLNTKTGFVMKCSSVKTRTQFIQERLRWWLQDDEAVASSSDPDLDHHWPDLVSVGSGHLWWWWW